MSTTKKMGRKKSAGGKRGNVRTARQRTDDSIMGTNDSSIVSKRSVTKLYYSNEPDFYEPFVQKYVRRNPLINRGYWLRMHAVENVVQRFLEEDMCKSKVIVNLGCGYDPLPFQFWHRHASISQKATFVDVDYPQLMSRKRDRILTTNILRDALFNTNVRSSRQPIYIRSDQYIAIGCDLRDLDTLERILRAELNLAESSILFVAEVSLTYMPVTDSDSLIRWACALSDARFCLLEQYLPQGPDHPFAQTMLRHFEKLQTTIHAVKNYPLLTQQSSRFTSTGWSVQIARNLWDLWSDDEFTPPMVRSRLAAVEPFDEWEEFALFCGHYFLLVASNTEKAPPISAMAQGANAEGQESSSVDGHTLTLAYHAPPQDPSLTLRRFGSAFALSPEVVAFYGGQGSQSRLSNMDILARDGTNAEIQPCWSTPPQPRICHTVTSLDDATALLAGGRTSPTNALADCWLVKHGSWQQVDDLSPARFRHSSVRVTIRSEDPVVEGILVFGGKTGDDRVLDDWTLWTPMHGWRMVSVDGLRPSARFGAAISTLGSSHDRGILVGGMAPSGTVIDEIWEWRMLAAPHLQLTFTERTNEIQNSTADLTYGRLGANLVPFGNYLLLIGGVSGTGVHNLSEDFLLISQDPGSIVIRIEAPAVNCPSSVWPLLVGAGAAAVSQDEVVIAGGGAVCFSMGSFWNEGFFTITTRNTDLPGWKALVPQSMKENTVEKSTRATPDCKGARTKQKKFASPKTAVVPRSSLHSPEEFAELLAASQPVIIEGLDIGPCRELWSLEYLREKVGVDREIVVHDCNSDRMTFKDKNFQYVKKSFGHFIDDISAGSKSYLRAVSSTQPFKLPTNLENDFPAIAADFELPDVFDFIKANQHSSPLRISGPVALWLHYDVLANVLCQIRGSKTLHLYPPSDVRYLSYPPGGSSSNVDVLTSKDPALRHTHPHTAFLQPGDILFIPPMWSHTAMPEDGVSVAVNVFFKNLESGYAAGRDVYGNRDLAAYEHGRRDVERIAKAFKNVPGDMAKFYMDRLAAELQDKADIVGKER